MSGDLEWGERKWRTDKKKKKKTEAERQQRFEGNSKTGR